MTQDYKYRANQNKQKPQQTAVAWWKWLLIVCLSTLLLSVINKQAGHELTPEDHNPKPKEPWFEFYTILPKIEVEVPDYEIKTRSREEQFGKGKSTQYTVQVGAFREFSEANKLKARLALLNIKSCVGEAKVGSVIWNRVKIGPFSRSSKVSAVKTKLRTHQIDVIVTEVKKES